MGYRKRAGARERMAALRVQTLGMHPLAMRVRPRTRARG
jgi:hypothetical protein